MNCCTSLSLALSVSSCFPENLFDIKSANHTPRMDLREEEDAVFFYTLENKIKNKQEDEKIR